MAMVGTDTADRLDDRDLESLIEEMRPYILRFAARRVGHERAEEVFSDVCLAAVSAHRRGLTICEPWLMAVARYKSVDVLRGHGRRRELAQRLQEDRALQRVGAGEPQPRSDAENTLDTLAPRHRSLLHRHYVEGVPVGEIAASDGVTYKAAESAMARARRAFRREYDRVADAEESVQDDLALA